MAGAFALLAVLCGSAGATVTAYTGSLPADETPSPYFSAWADNISLHVYQAPVRSVNFTAFPSSFTGMSYSPTTGAPANTGNLGIGSFASFMLTGTATVAISFPTTMPNGSHPATITSASQVKILPSLGAPTITVKNGNTITFPVTQKTVGGVTVGQQFTVEFEGDWLNAIHIFVNPYETAPTGGTSMTPSTQASPTTQANITGATFPIVFGPGEYWISGNLSFPTGGEVYLADGAILKRALSTGSPAATNSGPMLAFGNNYPNVNMSINVHGPGILDGTGTQEYASSYGCGTAEYPITATNVSTNGGNTINFSGFTIRNACSWNFPLGNAVGTSTSPVTVNNIKILGFSGNTQYTAYDGTTKNEGESDGIDIEDCQWVTVEHSFIRTMDDLIVVYQNRSAPVYETNNISAHDNILWNEYAHAMLVGPTQYNGSDGTAASQNVTFDSNTVIHDTGAAFLMGVYNYAPGTVQNLTWSNINVEENRALISLGSALGTGATGAPPIIGTSSFTNINAVTQTAQTISGINVVAVPNIQLFVRLPNSDSSWVGSGGSVIPSSTFSQVYTDGTWTGTGGAYTSGTLVSTNTVAADPSAGGSMPGDSTVLSTAEYRSTGSAYIFNSTYTADDIAAPTFH
ncbi:glycosyl hydrolase family 28 protein [Granulicella rosea]|uniref:glycosyl hydrolase family 28 protein n=1 Tax=Granulicella rosea TaxID=474952 RepID=UPI000B770587|nr:glycosyl hydrolase family 28 protein [Granulicella rosea]